MDWKYYNFAASLTQHLVDQDQFGLYSNTQINSHFGDRFMTMDMCPLSFDKQRRTLEQQTDDDEFSPPITFTDLILIYHHYKRYIPEPLDKVDKYAEVFLDQKFEDFGHLGTEQNVKRIWKFVYQLDPYTAVKSIESFVTNPEILSIFEVADENGWDIHYDHMAIRCGSTEQDDSKFVSEMLADKIGYQSSELSTQKHYKFVNGWSAYPMYKLLTNGQVMRTFVDQSDTPTQIIQHWNRVYGYTCHHITFRATKVVDRVRHAVSLADLTEKLNAKGVETLPPTGEVTNGLLEQLFTKPQVNDDIPQEILDDLEKIDPTLVNTIKNGKLIELVSRAEMDPEFASTLFEMRGISYTGQTCPIYDYFLPDQAMHVIKTSQVT